jgi:hypothetical protein
LNIFPHHIAFFGARPLATDIVVCRLLQTRHLRRQPTPFPQKVKKQEVKVGTTISIDMARMKLHLQGNQGTNHNIIGILPKDPDVSSTLKGVLFIDHKIQGKLRLWIEGQALLEKFFVLGRHDQRATTSFGLVFVGGKPRFLGEIHVLAKRQTRALPVALVGT